MKLLILVDAHTIMLHESAMDGDELIRAVHNGSPCLHLPPSQEGWQALLVKDLVIAIPALQTNLKTPAGLSRRQVQVLDGLQAGLNTKQIAARMNISQAAVQKYIRQMLARLGVTSREQAVLKTLSGDYLPCGKDEAGE